MTNPTDTPALASAIKTGADLKAWRKSKDLSKGQVAGLLSVKVRTITLLEGRVGDLPEFYVGILNKLASEYAGKETP